MKKRLAVGDSNPRLTLAARCQEHYGKYNTNINPVTPKSVLRTPAAVVWPPDLEEPTQYSTAFISILCSAPEFSLPEQGVKLPDCDYVTSTQHLRAQASGKPKMVRE